MHLLKLVQACALQKASPLTWKVIGDDAAFIFDIPPDATGFAGFFLIGSKGSLTPAIRLDEGFGFNEMTAISLKAFPIAFYHVPVRHQSKIRRISFQPSSEHSTFRFLALWTQNSTAIAILHYLFNLRYQNIGIMAPPDGKLSFWSSLKKTSTRITKFFFDISKGEGVRIQTSNDALLKHKLYMSLAAQDVKAHMADVLSAADKTPLISFVVPTYNTDPAYLSGLLQSYKIQDAAYAELIFSDDGSTNATTLAWLSEARLEKGITVLTGSSNQGIAAATNAGVAAAKGAWISFIDHDDQFIPNAIAVIANATMEHPDADFFYTDEIVTDVALNSINAFCKPAFDSVLLSGVNYINHFSVFRRDQLQAIGNLRTDRDGSQDYDLLLRYLKGPQQKRVVHIPYPAYLWRSSENTYSQLHVEKAVARARQALTDAYQSPAYDIEIMPALDPNLHRISFKPKAAWPLISIIIPNKDSFDLITRIIEDLLQRTAYPSLEIIIVDNGSHDTKVLAFYEKLRRDISSVTIDIQEEPFNFARMCNRGVTLAKGEAFLFLNNDIEVCEPHWLREMGECLSYDKAGIVGAKLLYPDGTVQHNGVIVGLGQAAGHWFVGEAADHPGPMGRFNVRQTLTAVTGACMLVTRACFDTTGAFDEINFAIAYNDIDFCLRARKTGFRTIWTPFAQLIHHESASRGSDETGENNIRFTAEFARLQALHDTVDYIDDAYSPFYDRRYSVPSLIAPPKLPKTRPNLFS